MIPRREFITLLGGAAVWPLAARAQQPAMPVIGSVWTASRTFATDRYSVAFREGLAEWGFIAGRNVAIEDRSTDGHLDRLPRLIVDLVRRPVAVIFVAAGDVPALVAKGATRTTPIVFLTSSDPVRSGLVASLSRPGLNATGVTYIGGSLGPKRLEMLHELVPKAATVGLLVNPHNTNSEAESADVQAGARTIGLQIHVLEASSSAEIDRAFATLIELKAGALLVNTDPLFFFLRDQFVTLAARHALPTMFYAREFPEAGGLISYGASIAGGIRQCGNYVGRILKGENPADLPIVQPTRFELVVNLKSAKALGLIVSDKLLATADGVIE
jgi:putative tryptophan/tyrosine transport system substrate-binding protein